VSSFYRKFFSLFFILLNTALQAGAHSVIFEVNSGQTMFSLPHRLVSIDSVLWEEGRDTLRWRLDPVEGRFVVFGSVDSTHKIQVFYSTPEWSVPLRQNRGIRSLPELFPEEKPETQRPLDGRQPESEVMTRGTIFRSVQVSTTGQSSLSGGMDLKIQGELMPDVFLTGVISDHETPFESRMSSQSLEELDKIYLELETPLGKGRMGDVEADYSWSPFSRYTGRLTGLTAANSGIKDSDKKFNWEAFAGTPAGRFYRQDIQLREGDQGPYRLSPPALTAVVIIPGSERIYLNGILVPPSRYLADYSAAEITFSTGQILSVEDRVVVEFRYRNEWYPRLTAGAFAGRSLGNHTLRFFAINESDDASRPLDESLADMDPDSLQLLQEGAYVSTAIPDTSGDYVLTPGGFWHYAGQNKGTHTVRFYRENNNGGYVRRYQEEGFPYYAYDPDDPLSQYFPRRSVILPETKRMFGAGWHWKLLSGALSADVTGSRHERSFTGDKEISGYSANWLADLPFPGWGFKSKGWLRSHDFTSFEPVQSVTLSREMGYSPLDTIFLNTQSILNFNGDVFRNDVEWQTAESSNDTLRHRFGLQGFLGNKYRLEWQGFRLRDTAWLPYYQLSLQGQLRKKSTSYIGWQKTVFEPIGRAIAEKSEFIHTGFTFFGGSSAEYRYREDYQWDGSAFERYSKKHDLGFKGQMNRIKHVNWQGEFTGRYDHRKESGSFYLLTSNRINWEIPFLKVSGQINSQINRTSESRREALFIRVAEGMGQYRWDADYGEYVPDPLGNYVLRREQTNDRQDQYVHQSGTAFKWQNRFKRFTLRYQFTGDVEYRAEDLILFQSVSLNDPDPDVLTARLRARNNVSLVSPGQKRALRFITNHQQIQNTRDLHSESLSRKDEGEIRWRARNRAGYVEMGIHGGKDRRERLPLNSYSVSNERFGGIGEFNWSPSQKAGLSTSLSYTSIQSDFLGDAFSSGLSEGELNGSWSRKPGEQVTGRLTLSYVKTGYQGPLPYEIANGLPAGQTLQAMFRYERRLSDILSLNGLVQYRKRAETKAVTLIRVEARAYF